MRKSILRTNHTYHNCLLESYHLENRSVLSGVVVGDRNGYIRIMPHPPPPPNNHDRHRPKRPRAIARTTTINHSPHPKHAAAAKRLTLAPPAAAPQARAPARAIPHRTPNPSTNDHPQHKSTGPHPQADKQEEIFNNPEIGNHLNIPPDHRCGPLARRTPPPIPHRPPPPIRPPTHS